MAHPQQIEFCTKVKNAYFPNFRGDALDIGSLDVNGNNRYLFEGGTYLGVDLAPGNNVDVISRGHEFKSDKKFDVVISTECFEHDKMWKETIQNCIDLVKPGGIFMFTCATTGREEHGTSRSCPGCSPFTSKEWGEEYYQNLTEKDIREAVDFSSFKFTEFTTNTTAHDLYFYGFKRDIEPIRPEIEIDTTKKLYNYYHIFADGPGVMPSMLDYIAGLKESGLHDALTEFCVGIVGTDVNRQKIKDFLDTQNLKYTVVAEATKGWEQVTQNKLYEFSLNHDGYVLYAHTKGASDPSTINLAWRESMIVCCVDEWKIMVDKLKTVTAAGSHWLTNIHHISINQNFFGGTFWWTHLSYIRSLGPPENQNRHQAEIWIGKRSKEPGFTHYDATKGWPGFSIFRGNPYRKV